MDLPDALLDVAACISHENSYVPYVIFRQNSSSSSSRSSSSSSNHTIVNVSDKIPSSGLLVEGEGEVPLGKMDKSVENKSVEIDSGWAMKVVNISVDCAFSSSELLHAVAAMLLKSSVLPFHVVHIEHCKDCAKHGLSTRYNIIYIC